MDTIGQRIKEVRNNIGYTQEKFASELNLKQQTIAVFELGKRNPSERTISDICEKFNVNEDWLRTGEGEMLVQRTRNQVITDFLGDLIIEDATFKKRLIEALAELEERDWESLERLANKLTSKRD